MPETSTLIKFCKRKFEDIPDKYKCCQKAIDACKQYIEGTIDCSTIYVIKVFCSHCETDWGELKFYKVIELHGIPTTPFQVANIDTIEIGEGFIHHDF